MKMKTREYNLYTTAPNYWFVKLALVFAGLKYRIGVMTDTRISRLSFDMTKIQIFCSFKNKEALEHIIWVFAAYKIPVKYDADFAYKVV